MSSYVSFYLKGENEKFMPIASFSRSSAEYEYGQDYIFYGKCKPLRQSTIIEIMGNIERERANDNTYREAAIERKSLIAKMNNSVNEKLEAIFEIDATIKEYDELKDALERAYGFYRTLMLMTHEVEYPADNAYGDPDTYIYAGIECGDPNEEDNDE